MTVLFADLVGFTPFAEERDAEDVRETLSRYFEIASEVIGRYGGTVEKFIGDAVMALWGAPTAHEDDAERAVRAGLELVDAVRTLGASIQARVGVLSGEAAVTLGATNQGMVAGDLVNTAARLQSVAEPGTVLVGSANLELSNGADYVDIPFTVTPGTFKLDATLDWMQVVNGTFADLDFFLLDSDGKVVTSSTQPGGPEHITTTDIHPGNYTYRVDGYLAVNTNFTITSSLSKGNNAIPPTAPCGTRTSSTTTSSSNASRRISQPHGRTAC